MDAQPLTAPDDTWIPVDDTGFIAHVGPMFTRTMPQGAPHLGFRAADHHKNLNGVVQGGMMMTLADRGMGRVARAAHGGGPVATVSFTYDFIGAGRIGDFIELHPRITRETGSLVFMEGQLFTGDTLIGRATGVWKKLKQKPV